MAACCDLYVCVYHHAHTFLSFSRILDFQPKIQGPATIDYSWWHGLIDEPTRNALHHEWENCMLDGKKGTGLEPPPFHLFNVQDDCGIMW